VLETAGRVLQTFAVEITPEQRIAAVYTTRNPDKLAHLPVAS
jgi:hypothetical protein